MVSFADMHSEGPNDRPISVSGIYGAENVTAKEFQFDVGKMRLFELFCESHGIR